MNPDIVDLDAIIFYHVAHGWPCYNEAARVEWTTHLADVQQAALKRHFQRIKSREETIVDAIGETVMECQPLCPAMSTTDAWTLSRAILTRLQELGVVDSK